MRTALFCMVLLHSLAATAEPQDSVAGKARTTFLSRITKPFVRLFADVDTDYIEPNHYNFQAMVQDIYSYEVYKLTDDNGNSIRFEPKPSMKIGPYVGWSLIFLGVTVDVLHLDDGNKRKEWDLSLYTLPLGIDIYYRESGDSYMLKDVRLNGVDTEAIDGISYDGIKSSVSGADIYYIFNHRKFSHPAAFNQSTQQKRSRGSALAGIGFTRHSLSIDWVRLNEICKQNLGIDVSEDFNENRLFEKITYTDISVSGGYGYNWVFAPSWLFGSSVSAAMSYKQSIADSKRGFDAIGTSFENLRDFKFSDLTFDFVGRFGLVYNNGKWFAGFRATVHSYNYSKSNFYTNNVFGSFNAYVGINFGKKKAYKNTVAK